MCMCVCVCVCACVCVRVCAWEKEGCIVLRRMYVTVKQMQDCGLVDVTQTDRLADTEPNRLTYELESFSQVH